MLLAPFPSPLSLFSLSSQLRAEKEALEKKAAAAAENE